MIYLSCVVHEMVSHKFKNEISKVIDRKLLSEFKCKGDLMTENKEYEGITAEIEDLVGILLITSDIFVFPSARY